MFILITGLPGHGKSHAGKVLSQSKAVDKCLEIDLIYTAWVQARQNINVRYEIDKHYLALSPADKAVWHQHLIHTLLQEAPPLNVVLEGWQLFDCIPEVRAALMDAGHRVAAFMAFHRNYFRIANPIDIAQLTKFAQMR